MLNSRKDKRQAGNLYSAGAAWVPIAAICCLLIVMFLIATTIVLSLIPVYLPRRNYGRSNLVSSCGFNLTQTSIYSTMSTMYGGVLGDFNQDSRLDIAVPNYDTQNVGIFLANADGTFAPQQTFSTGANSNPYWISTSDFNKDNLLDLAVADFQSGTVDIFLCNGDGTFTPNTTLSTGNSSQPVVLAIADLNKDNQLDIVSDNFGTDSIGIFLGLGNQLFTSQMTLSTGNGSKPYYVVVADLNQDTILDIVVANSVTNNIGIFFGYGNGTFTSQTTLSTGAGSNPFALAIADFNQDNLPDIAVANNGAGNVGLFYGNGDGSFKSMRTFSTGAGSEPYLLAIGDLNKDNRIDIGVANYGTNNIGVLLGNGSGTFAPQRTFSTGIGSQTTVVLFGDLNQDGRLDVVAGNVGTKTISTFLTTC